MLYKKIGNTDVPAIGQGTGGIYNVAIIKAGIDVGLTLIDTAESYNNEDIIGQAIKGKRDKVFISTKFSPEHNSYDDVIKSCEASLKRLDTDYIDLYSAHYRNPKIPEGETIRALAKLKADGKIRYIGVCNSYRPTLAGELVDAIQAEYNLFDRSPEKSLLPSCEANSVALLAYSPLKDFRNLYPESMLWLADIQSDRTFSQKILNWLISHKPVIALTSSRDIKHVQKNAVASDFTMSEADIKRIDELFQPNIIEIPLERIDVTLSAGELPLTKDEAMAYSKWVVKPEDVDLSDFKPVKLFKASYGDYQIEEGGFRYWAWAIQKNKPIPAIVKHRWLVNLAEEKVVA